IRAERVPSPDERSATRSAEKVLAALFDVRRRRVVHRDVRRPTRVGQLVERLLRGAGLLQRLFAPLRCGCALLGELDGFDGEFLLPFETLAPRFDRVLANCGETLRLPMAQQRLRA